MFDVAQAAVEGALAAGAGDADARVVIVRSELLTARNGVLERVTQAERAGLGVRVMVGQGSGFFAHADLTTRAARRAGSRPRRSLGPPP